MEYSDLHRKIMFAAPTSEDVDRGGGQYPKECYFARNQLNVLILTEISCLLPLISIVWGERDWGKVPKILIDTV